MAINTARIREDPRRSGSESTERNGDGEEKGSDSRTSSLDSDERKEEVATDLDEEKTIGSHLDNITTNENTSNPQRQTLPHAKSLRSIKSHQSRAGADGYTCFADEDEDARPNKSSGAIPASDEPFLVKWEGGDADPNNPRSMTKLRRWAVVFIVSASSLCVTCTSSLYTSTYSQLIPEFHSSRLVCTLGLSLFVAGLGTGPMILSPLSEFYGRRPIYICSFSFFLIFMIPCAVARNIQTMLVARFLDGLAGSAFLSVAGGTVGDMFAKHELSAPMMIYTASPFVGPEVGPLLGGFIVQNTTWRWCFYVLTIWSALQLALIVFFVPETYHPVLLRRKAIRLRKETGNPEWIAPIEKMSRSITKTVLWSCIRPFQLLFFEPMCLNLCILSAILLGILYLFFGAFPLVFQNNHGFTISQTGLSFLGLFVGMLIGIASDPLWRRCYERLVRQQEAQGGEPGGSEPEFRLPSTIAGAFVVPIALFGFGWTTYSHVHWIVPIIFSAIFGTGVIWVYSGVFTFLVEAYPVYAASALAANSFARSYFAAAFPLFGVQMYNNLGYQWATTVLAFLALAMAPFPILFFRFGQRLRGNSRFASA
ncbi:MFS general substrate transporter [Lentithecium fluviatile CBS 122367]|uniref:MFS general substrate transporter n=1 Tax=Lentithecium fluviatile CBS 122367 TaxID=1168545 RepID=A0A6G1INJ9_9PLEO|nr:MFS general substrate transporter [Lentithecium fluviatile CBS 122367]